MTRAEYQRLWKAGHFTMIPAGRYRDALRAAWRTQSIGQLAAATGLAPSTLQRVMWRDGSVQTRTAVKLEVWMRAPA